MAKGSYKVTFKSNFSFERLSKNLDGILGAKNEEIIDILAQITKRNISDGKLRPLTPTTLEVRRRGLSTFSRSQFKANNRDKAASIYWEAFKFDKASKRRHRNDGLWS